MNEIRKILIIEDDTVLLNCYVDVLQYEGYVVFSTESGKQGLEIFFKERPDLVLLDIGLPDINGFDVLEKMQSLYDVIMIIITGKEDKELYQGLNKHHVDEVLKEPIGRDEIVQTINDVLVKRNMDSEKKEDPKIFECPYFTLNYETGRLKSANYDEKLPQSEFLVIQYLIKYKGLTVSRIKLETKFWGSSDQWHDKSLRNVICELRKKIEIDHNEPKIIITIKNTGYMLAID